jgi:hypothetical protein
MGIKQSPILHLNLTKRWFDAVGVTKFEEYRALTPYWGRVFVDGKIRIRGKLYEPNDVIVCFSNGYAKNRPQKTFRIKGMSIGIGRPDWGAVNNTEYYIITLTNE